MWTRVSFKWFQPTIALCQSGWPPTCYKKVYVSHAPDRLTDDFEFQQSYSDNFMPDWAFSSGGERNVFQLRFGKSEKKKKKKHGWRKKVGVLKKIQLGFIRRVWPLRCRLGDMLKNLTLNEKTHVPSWIVGWRFPHSSWRPVFLRWATATGELQKVEH